jgi:hypothetical protein
MQFGDPQVIGLEIFVIVVVLDLMGLAFDVFLYLTGQKTITEHVWAQPILGVPILFLQQVAVFGLAVHFYWRVFSGKVR